jgi:hypothetical protein
MTGFYPDVRQKSQLIKQFLIGIWKYKIFDDSVP